MCYVTFFFFQAEDGIRDIGVTGVQTCALPICRCPRRSRWPARAGPRSWRSPPLSRTTRASGRAGPGRSDRRRLRRRGSRVRRAVRSNRGRSGGPRRLPVLALPPGAVAPVPDVTPPGLVLEIPADCLPKPRLEALLRREAELALDLAGIHGIPAVVTGPVLHEGQQLGRGPAGSGGTIRETHGKRAIGGERVVHEPAE